MERHRFNLVSFIFGLLFVGATAAHFGGEVWPDSLDSRWIWPALLVMAGIAVLAGAVNAIPAKPSSTGSVEELSEPDVTSEPALGVDDEAI